MEINKITADTDFTEGVVINVDKPYGWTSADVVRKLKFLLSKISGHKKLKVGHAGTLDPLATGVLLVCVGKATKQADALQAERKEYVAEVMLGATTPSYDLEHPVDATYPWEHITPKMVEQALRDLTGERLQTPPIYSAKKFEGRHAYDFAREGEELKMESRQVLINIYNIEILELDLPRLVIRVECSKGTYIRSLACEIGEQLQSGAHLTALRRTRSGEFTTENAFVLDDLLKKLHEMKQNLVDHVI
ncbi:MAG: tRNA pseudouridine(55) synthase TruB [Rikenellaceae bacterium]|nr:tRNA pseudouridine(55) synthase TruB [Rikenellaceae bacterium]